MRSNGAARPSRASRSILIASCPVCATPAVQKPSTRSTYAACASAVMGSHVRVGLEDGLFIGRGQLAESNAEQVAKIRRILNELSIEIATPEEARQILGLSGTSKTP